MKTVNWIIFLLIAAAAGNADAASLAEQNMLRNAQMDTRLTQTVTVADLVTYAYLNNPSILSAKEAWKATVEKYRLKTGYPDPQLSMTYFPAPIETRLGPQDWNLTISQKIPFPGSMKRNSSPRQLHPWRWPKHGLSRENRVFPILSKPRPSGTIFSWPLPGHAQTTANTLPGWNGWQADP